MNESNDVIIQTNQMLRKGLQKLNANYVELVEATEEAVRRRKVAQQKNEEKTNKGEEIMNNLCVMQRECSFLQKKAQSLNGLVVLADFNTQNCTLGCGG